MALAQWPPELGSVEEWGLSRGTLGVQLPPSLEALSNEAIREGLGHRATSWLRNLEIHTAISSTSDRLLSLADSGSIDGVVCLAELQTKGRGRRGRTWLTPLGGNLAISAGFAVGRPLADLGGLSLVVGLALIDALGELGCGSVALKWPNDLMWDNAKLGGILIELKTVAADQLTTEAIVGVGINVSLPEHVRDAIDQKVIDLAAAAATPIHRNALAAQVIESLIDYVGEFEQRGFAPMREQYNRCHWLHDKPCEVRIGAEVVTGRVAGVTDIGELELATAGGRQIFRGGEVSLRQSGGGRA